MFRDVIQQVMEVEMDEALGRERCQRAENEAPNYRNGYSRKTVKTQLDEIKEPLIKSARSAWREVLTQIKVQKTKECFAYFKFYELKSWGKKSASHRRRFGQRFLNIKVPRDRQGHYESKIISKYDRNAEGMEDTILSLYAFGMSQRDIAEQVKSLYNVEISPELVSKISEKIMPEVNAWQNQPLENVYPFIQTVEKVQLILGFLSFCGIMVSGDERC